MPVQAKAFPRLDRAVKLRGRPPTGFQITAAWLVVTRVAGDWEPVADLCGGVRAWPLYESGGEAESVAAQFAAADPDGDYRAAPVSASLAPRYA